MGGWCERVSGVRGRRWVRSEGVDDLYTAGCNPRSNTVAHINSMFCSHLQQLPVLHLHG